MVVRCRSLPSLEFHRLHNILQSLLFDFEIGSGYCFYYWVSGSFVNTYKVVEVIWVWSTMVDGRCIPRVAEDVCILNGFFTLLLCSYLKFVTLVNGWINHTVHQREPVFLSQWLFGLGLAQVSKVVS